MSEERVNLTTSHLSLDPADPVKHTPLHSDSDYRLLNDWQLSSYRPVLAVVKRDGSLLYLSDALKEALHISETAPHLNLFSFLTQEESDRISNVLNRLPAHLGPVRIDAIHFQANPRQTFMPQVRSMPGYPDACIIEFYREFIPEDIHDQQLIRENEQLRQEQERGRHILDALQKGSKGLLILNEDLSIYYFNAPVQEWINITESDIGRPIHHFTFNIPLPGIADILVNAQAGTTTRLDDIISDTQKTLRLTIAPLGSEQAPARMVALLFQLMSADPQNHPSPAQSSAQKAFTESTPHPVYVLDRPLNRITYLALNDTFLGYTRAELLKMDVPQILSFIHPEDTDTAIDHFLAQAELRPYSEWIFKEFRMKDKNGLWAWVRAQEKVSRRNPDGSILELVGIIRDITEEKERELALKTRVKQLQSMIHFSGSAMAFISPDGFISESNFEAARLSNATAQGLKGSHFTESAAFVLTMDGKAQAQELCAQAVKTGEIQMYKDVLHGVRDETIRALSVSLKPLKNEAGTVTMLLAESQDTTHALQKQEEMNHKIELLMQIPLNMKGVGVLVVDRNLNFLLSKGPFLKQSGFDDIEGKNLYDFFPPEISERLAQHYKKALSGEIVQFEGTHKERSVYTTRIIPLTNARDEIYAAMAISQDITEMRQVQNAIDTVAHSIIVPSEQEFFDNLTRSLGSILDVNHVFIGEFHQETFSIHTPAYWRNGEMVHQFEYSIDGTPTQRILQQQTPLIFNKEAWKAFPKDPYLQVQKVEGYIGYPLFDSSEQMIGLLVVMKDQLIENVEMAESIIKVFTSRAGAELERQKAQRALLAQEQIYRTLAQNIPDGLVIVFDPGLKVRMFEGQLAQFFSRDQKVKESLMSRWQGDLRTIWLSLVLQVHAVLDGQTQQAEFSIGNRIFWANLLPLQSEDGSVYSGVALIQEITGIKKTEQQLAEKLNELSEQNNKLERYIESNLELEKFAFIASHDLKEPLRTIGGFASLLERRYADALDDQAREYIAYISGGIRKMNRFIHDLLQYSRITFDENQEQYREVPFHELLSHVTDSLKRLIREQKVRIEVGEVPETLVVQETRMQQLFQNLLANAVKFRKATEVPHIKISGTEEGDAWHFTVEDNGIGIDPQFHTRIFLPFRRLHTQMEYDGSGLGLALCARVAEQHKGRIWVESTPDVGSVFHFILPRSPQAVTATEAPTE